MNKNLSLIISCICLMIPSLNYSNSKEGGWRGIVPLHSTRADVERILGRTPNERTRTYYLKDCDVYVVYSREDDCKRFPNGWNVPPNTVIRFDVILKSFP